MFSIRRVADSNGNHTFDPDGCAHTYTYNTDGTIATDLATNTSGSWLKTYAYTSGQLTGESQWVKQ